MTLTNQYFIVLNFTFPKSDLVYLNLANNDIYTIKDSVFQNLQKLEVLILSHNDLELMSPNALKGVYMPERYEPLKCLKELRLDHNRLHTLNTDLFEHTTDLEILDLSYNPFTVIDYSTVIAIDTLINLKELYLAYTQISTLPELILHTPLNLRVLDLSGNPMDIVPATLKNSHNLTTLFLNDTNFVNLTKANGFPLLPSLKVLYMCHLTNVERIEKEALGGLPNLEELYISDNIKLNYIDGFSLALIDKENDGTIRPFIKKLHLRNNKIAFLEGDFLARWDALIELDLGMNPWTCECENQWMVDDLMPIYLKIEKEKASLLGCQAPIEMVGYTFAELYERKYNMRCLDAYGAEPENDAALLVGVLAGILIAIPLILFGIYAYQRKWFGLLSMCDSSPAAYSRRFYKSTRDEDF
ncbi:toll-like receptor 9 isoform X2 [Anthonomus grandis grandis]|nr:toll-like receptor 9 isoform X2 [Anthonomus grandis grandis]